jgi:head-tail adaptor
MNIAAMRVRVTFQKNAVTVDKYGNHKTGWTDYFSCWATVGSNTTMTGTGTGSESTGVVIRAEESLAFTCRWCSELAVVESTKYRIICEDKIYNITYVNPMGFKKNSLKFNCELEKKS